MCLCPNWRLLWILFKKLHHVLEMMKKSWVSSAFHAWIAPFAKRNPLLAGLGGINIRTVNHFCLVCLGILGRNPRGLWVMWRLYFGIFPKTSPLYTITVRLLLQGLDFKVHNLSLPFFPHSHVNSKLGSFSVIRQLSWAFLSQRLGLEDGGRGARLIKMATHSEEYWVHGGGNGRERERIT